MKSLQKKSYDATIFAVILTASYPPTVCYMTLWCHKHSNAHPCGTSHLCTSLSVIQSPCVSFTVGLNSLSYLASQQTTVLSVRYWQAVGLFFVPYNILIVYCKAKYLTVKIDVFILPYKKWVREIALEQTKSIICVANHVLLVK